MSERAERRGGAGLALAFAWFLLAAALAAAIAFVLTRPPHHPEPLLAFSAEVPPEPLALLPAPTPLSAADPPAAAGQAPRLAGLQSAPLAGSGLEETAAPSELLVARDAATDDGEGTEASGEASPGGEQLAARPAVPAPLPPPPEAPPAWQRFAADFANPQGRPMVAVVVSGLGLSEAATEAAIRRLPPGITLSFSPYARRLDEWIALARAHGHEVLLDLPMEPESYPRDDPGPGALLTSLGPQENRARLQWVLGRGSAYVGLTGVMGSRFVASEESLAPVLRDVADRGLIFVDNRPGDGAAVEMLAAELELPLLVNDRTLDGQQASRPAIDARLAEVERLALTNGRALAIAHPYPVTIERLAEWSATLPGRRLALAPVSALLR